MECPICLVMFTDGGDHEPRMIIPSGQTVCISCLRRLQEPICPITRQAITKPIEDLPKNFALIQALREKDEIEMESNPRRIRIVVGEAHGPHRMMINHSSKSQLEWDAGAPMSCAGWTHKMEFEAFSAQQPGTIRIAIGEAHGPHRLMINHNSKPQSDWDAGASMDLKGWKHKMDFWVYPTPQPGTIRIAVGEAHEPHRMMINHSYKPQSEWDAGASMDFQGWKHKMDFWAFPVHADTVPRRIRIVVGEAHGPHRMMINHSSKSQLEWDAGAPMSCAGWTHKMEFEAFSAQQPGTIRIAIGEAHGPHRLMINHNSKPQSDWDAGASMDLKGWKHKMDFWVYPTPQPGTIRIAVGEAHEPHRMMINHSYKPQSEWDAGASMDFQGWKHKMDFWAFPVHADTVFAKRLLKF